MARGINPIDCMFVKASGPYNSKNMLKKLLNQRLSVERKYLEKYKFNHLPPRALEKFYFVNFYEVKIQENKRV